MIAFGLGLVLALVLVARRLRRRAVAERRGGSGAAPVNVVVRTPELGTGPKRRAARAGAGGVPLVGRALGSPAYALRRVAWLFVGALCNGGGRLNRLIGTQGIVIFVGPNGSGKSLAAVESLLPTLAGQRWECDDLAHFHNRPVREHRDVCGSCSWDQSCEVVVDLVAEHSTGMRFVYSTLPLLDDVTGDLHPLYRPLESARQLPWIEHSDVLFDEVAGVSDADSSASMPSAMKRWLQQLRKRDVMLRVTTPAYDRCSLPIRQIATVVVDCRSFFHAKSRDTRRWRPTLAMSFEAYDAFSFGSFDKHSGNRLPRLAREFYWRPSNRGMNSYRTLEQVSALSDVDETGSCIYCNGTRSRPKCACAPGVDEIPLDELVVVEVDGPRGGKARSAQRRGAASDPAGPGTGAGPETCPDVPGLDVPTLGAAASAAATRRAGPRHATPVPTESGSALQG